jgi:hypothetical protein
MPDLTPESLDELWRLAEAATPRPWSTVSGAGNIWHFPEDGTPTVVAGYRRAPRVPDAILIAAAVNALPALLGAAAERDALAAKVEATPKTPLPALGDTSGTPSTIGGRVCRILGDRTAPMPPVERTDSAMPLVSTAFDESNALARLLADALNDAIRTMRELAEKAAGEPIPFDDLDLYAEVVDGALDAASERDALAAKVERVRALPAKHPAGGWYMTSMRDVLAALDEEPQP